MVFDVRTTTNERVGADVTDRRQSNTMPTNAKAAPAKKAATTPSKPRSTRRVFPVGQCHWRAGGLGDSKGASACKKAIVAKRANLCPEHEKIWQAAARKRYADNKAAKATPVKAATKSQAKPTSQTAPVPTTDEQLEEKLEASVSAFATPQLAAKAEADRVARKAPRA